MLLQGKPALVLTLKKKRSRDLMLDSFDELTPIKNELLNATRAYANQYFSQYSLTLSGAVSIKMNDKNGVPTTLTPENFDELAKPNSSVLSNYLYRSGNINIQHYQKGLGGYPHWHSEQFPQNGHNEALHRVVLYMFYLNDVAEGGETEFYYQQRKISPKKGTMVIAPASFTHSHRGNIPISNDKYIATSWMMFNRAERLYAPIG